MSSDASNEMLKTKTADPVTSLEIATNVLVRMEGYGRANARRFLGRCTADEVKQIARCNAPLDCDRTVGDEFRTTFGAIMDAIVKRQEAQDEKDKTKTD